MEFPSAKDNNQISFLKSKYPELFKSLVNFCSSKTEKKKEVRVILDNSKSDQETYSNLFDIFAKTENVVSVYNSVFTESELKKRSENRISDITGLLPQGFQPKKILDFGTGDGSILIACRDFYNLKPTDVVGLDKNLVKTKEFTFATDFNSVTEQFDLVLALMSIHHIEDQEKLISEIKRVLKPGGFLIIREHDVQAKETSVYIDIIHGIYSSSLSAETKNFKDEYFANYSSRNDLRRVFKTYGLKLVKGTSIYGVQRSYYDIFEN